jgi:hypothetical protein
VVCCQTSDLVRTSTAVRDALALARLAGRGRGMAPRGLGGCRKTATGRDKKRDHPASPVIVFRQLSRGGVSPLGGPAAGGGRAGLFIPVPCGCNRLRYLLRPALSPRVGQTNPCIPQGYTARSHHPRAVEHRDCPPCGGGALLSHGGGWVRVCGARYPPAECWNAVVKRRFQRALSPNWRGGFCGIQQHSQPCPPRRRGSSWALRALCL